MPVATPRQTEFLAHDSDGILAIWRQRVVLQVRRGTLPLALLYRIRSSIRALAASGKPVGALLVVEAGASMLPEETRKEQKTVVEEFASFPTARIAPVILGSDVPSTMNRTAGRLLAFGNPRIGRFLDIPTAATWLAAELEPLGFTVTSNDLVTIMEQLRELAKTPPKP